MKINLIGMILNNAGRRSFDGAILDDNGKPLPAADSLHHMIMEYAKVVNGGTSDIVTTSREVTAPAAAPQPTCSEPPPEEREATIMELRALIADIKAWEIAKYVIIPHKLRVRIEAALSPNRS